MIQHSSRGVQYVTCVMLHFTTRQRNVGLIKESLCVHCETNKKWQNSETGQRAISGDTITAGENRCNCGYIFMDWSSTWYVWGHKKRRWLICDSRGYQGLYFLCCHLWLVVYVQRGPTFFVVFGSNLGRYVSCHDKIFVGFLSSYCKIPEYYLKWGHNPFPRNSFPVDQLS